MQGGIMSMKNLVKHPGVHDKTDHPLVSQVTLTRWNHSETSQSHAIFVRMLQPYGIETSLKGHSNRVYLLPRLRLWEVLRPLPPDSGLTQKTF